MAEELNEEGVPNREPDETYVTLVKFEDEVQEIPDGTIVYEHDDMSVDVYYPKEV